jgi:hypothetical protein
VSIDERGARSSTEAPEKKDTKVGRSCARSIDGRARTDPSVGRSRVADVIVFGATDLAEMVAYYLCHDAGHRVMAFTVDCADLNLR